MANLGLIVGRVYSPGGGFMAKNVRVVMSKLIGHDGVPIGYNDDDSRKYIEDTTDDDGKFAIRFVWSGADIGSAVLFATATVSAYNEVTTRSGRTTTTIVYSTAKPKAVRMVLFRDFATLLNTAGSSFKSATDTMDFAVDLWAALRNVKIYPVWKTVQLWSTESWALCGGLEMELGK
jgi:hypothetical protein